MIDDELKAGVLVLLGLMAAVAVYPILAESRIVEPFSELGVLGPNMKIGDYPRTVVAGDPISLYLYVGNHMGRSEYYRVLVKQGDKSSVVSDETPLDAPVIYSYDYVLTTGSNSTRPITISVPRAGLNQRLVFELHLYDGAKGTFTYHQRWNQLWMNATSPTR